MREIRLAEIAKAVSGRLIGSDMYISAVCTDSRKNVLGALFVPILGESFDGHDFIETAVKQGAAAFLSAREIAEPSVPYVLVKDTRRALGDLASYYRSLFNIPVIAVTGSSGKTSVKNGVFAVLGQKFNALKTLENFNNDIGLPLTVFNLCEEHEAAVLEMGMNSFGEIGRLSEISRPDIGIVTNIGTAHIEHLGSREGILRAKLEIIDGMNERGRLILNYDNDLSRTLEGKLKQEIIWVSTTERIGVYAKDIAPIDGDEAGASITVCFKEREIPLHIPFRETPLISNALMAAAVGFLLGLTDDEIKRGVELGASEKGRLETYKTAAGGVIINDCYNANTESMRLALDALSRYNIEKIAILGDMFEQGKYAAAFHREIGEYACNSGVDVLIAIGNHARFYKEEFDKRNGGKTRSYYFRDKQDFFDSGFELGGEKAILLKASRVMRFEEILGFLIGREE